MVMLNRIFMFVYALVNVFVGVLILLIATKSISMDMLKDKIEPMTGSISFIVGAVVFIGLSLLALLVAMYSGEQKRILVRGSDNGEVYMTASAIGKLVERLVSQVGGLENIKVAVDGNNSYIKIIVTADAYPDCKIAETTTIVQERVKEGLAESLGREINKVDLRIKDVKQSL